MWAEIDDSAIAHSYLITDSHVDGAHQRWWYELSHTTNIPYHSRIPFATDSEMLVIYIELYLILKIPTIPFFTFTSFNVECARVKYIRPSTAVHLYWIRWGWGGIWHCLRIGPAVAWTCWNLERFEFAKPIAGYTKKKTI